MSENYKKIVDNIHSSLDELTGTLKGDNTEHSPSPPDILNSLYSTRLVLAEHYHHIPLEEARTCKERIEVIDGIVRDLFERQRMEALLEWGKKNE